LKDYEAKQLAEEYFKKWLKEPGKDTEKGGSFIAAIKYALMQYCKKKKTDRPPKNGLSP
jgi:hypothetical protein